MPKQNRWTSFIEAHTNALVGAPPAILANWLLLDYFYPKDADTHFAALWAIITWPIFFYLSVGRTFFLRRIFERWGVNLEPKAIYHYIRNRIKYGYWK